MNQLFYDIGPILSNFSFIKPIESLRTWRFSGLIASSACVHKIAGVFPTTARPFIG